MNQSGRSNRRDFLKGKSARDIGGAKNENPHPLPPVAESSEKSLARQASYLEQYSRNAMACEFEIFFNMHQYPNSGGAVDAGFRLLDELEDQMTVYRPHSEVSQINRLAASKAIEVENRLFQLLLEAIRIQEQTDGAFDITSGQLTRLWNFDRRAGRLPEQREIDATLTKVGSRHFALCPHSTTIRLNQPGVEINLGGIGKGYALDRLAELFEKMNINDFVIHGGQSSIIARGDSTTLETKEDGIESSGWTIGISHPTLPAVRLAEIRLKDQALGTSGTARQGFFHEGKHYGHIIDPRTGWPTSHTLSSTVVAGTAAQADALATAFYVMSHDEVESYCQQHPKVGAVLVLPTQTKSKPAIRIFNLQESEIQLTADISAG